MMVSLSKPWAEQNIDTVGYHYYMTPETAMLGIQNFQIKLKNNQRCGLSKLSNLNEMTVFSKK